MKTQFFRPRCRPQASSSPFRKLSTRSGAAVVEFAIVSPIMFLFAFGMIDIGRAVMVQNLLTNAARDGARTAALDGESEEGVRNQVIQYLADTSISGASVTISPSPLSSADLGDPVSVTVSVPFSSVSWLPSSMFLENAGLEATVVMRREVYIDPEAQ